MADLPAPAQEIRLVHRNVGHVTSASVRQQLDALCDGCVDVVTRADLEKRLGEGRPLRVKLGIDPSGPMLHLGHAVALRKLRQFQDFGHQAILIVGDFTAQIGDPTGRQESRKPRMREDIEADMRTYADQAAAILKIERASIVYNSSWLATISLAEFMQLCAGTTVARMLERDDFTKRHTTGQPIGLPEFLYPLTVAYDSVATNADVELGGSEQLFNLLMGRRMQEDAGHPPQICMTMPILEGTDGVQRMGKSLGNFIALKEPPNDMFGKIMSIPDGLLTRYWRLAAGASAEACEKIAANLAAGTLSPRDCKLELAGAIVRLYHGDAAAQAAKEHFERTVVRKELPDDVPRFVLPGDGQPLSVARLLVLLGWASSNRDATRLVQQGAVKVDGARVDDPGRVEPSWDGKVIQKGNHLFARLTAQM